MSDLPITREKGQRSLDIPYINRFYPQWAQPAWQKAEFWRMVVASLPYAKVCQERMIEYLCTLEWKIEPRDSTLRDELKTEIEYYTRLLEFGGDIEGGNDYVWLLSWVLQDYLTLPFGGAIEVIRYGDWPKGRVAKIIPLDAATLSPTLNKDYPVMQRVMESPTEVISFPKHAINRLGMSPRTEIKREGWFMAPPEKIFLAIEMLARGDRYYASLLIDTPEAGLLDLGDMSKTSAVEWVKAFKDLFTGIDGFKIPVLYEHTTQAKWIPFGKPPTDLMFDRITLRYAGLAAAGYGMSLSDIGLGGGTGGGDTLAGSIRDERKTKRSGFGKNKKAIQYFFNRLLPPTLQFRFIDLDDEQAVALGRARLANATAFNQYYQMGAFDRNEIRMQTMADGLITIGIPEKAPEREELPVEAQERPGMLGKPVAPSQGGHGEIKNALHQALLEQFSKLEDVQLIKAASLAMPWIIPEVNETFTKSDVNAFDEWDQWHEKILWGELLDDIPEFTEAAISGAEKELRDMLLREEWFADFQPPIEALIAQFEIVAKETILTQSRLDYVSGKSSKVNKDVIIDTSEFRVWLNEYFKKYDRKLIDVTVKSAISATRKALIRMGKVGILDTVDEIGDNKAINLFLAYLVYQSEALTQQYVEDMINEVIKLIGD